LNGTGADAARHIAIVLQTPRDRHSSVLQSYQGLASELERRGHRATIVTPQDFLSAPGLGGRFTPVVYPFVIARWMKREGRQLDLVVFHSYAGWRAVSAATRPDGTAVPTVIAFHGLEPLYHDALRAEAEQTGGLSRRYRALQEWLMPFMLKTACRSATRITCLNTVERDELVRRGWTTADRVDVVFHGVLPEFFLPARPPRPVRTLLFVGQWLPMKGIGYLCEAFAGIARRRPDVALICAGTLAPAEQVLAGFPPDVRPRVRVMPRLDRLALVDVYREADIMIAPSLYEGFGVALVEAMAARLPIVTTRVGVAADALSDGESALVIPTRQAQAIVGEVERLIGDAALRERLGEAAADAALHYRESAAVSHLADLLLRVIQSTL
jgi:glycosyltransferase involved in cell wall biosynthesis